MLGAVDYHTAPHGVTFWGSKLTVAVKALEPAALLAALWPAKTQSRRSWFEPSSAQARGHAQTRFVRGSIQRRFCCFRC